MNQVILLLSAALTLLTFIPVSRNSRWWIRVLDFPRLQLLLFAFCTIIVAGLYSDGFYRPMVILASTLCFFYHLYWIYPYTKLATPEVQSAPPDSQDPSISILTANVLMTNRDANRLIEIIEDKNPDVLLTLESDKWWEEKLEKLVEDYPYRVKCPLDNLYGMHLYSKLALHKSEIKYLVEEGIPSIHTEIELAHGARVRAHFLHPTPPVPEYSTSSSNRDAELIVVAKSLQDCDLPTIVSGDLNDVAWSETTRLFRKISGLLDPRVGRGMYNTFNANHWYLRWPLDHLFHSNHFQLCEIGRLRKFGSDHFALFTKLVYRDLDSASGEGLKATPADEDFAAEKLDGKDVGTKDVPLDASTK